MIERYDPFRQMMSLRQMMDRLLEDAFVMPREFYTTAPSTTALNVYEEDNNLIVEAPMPGVKPEDIDVTLDGGTLTIRGETKVEKERKERNYLIHEYRRGSYLRSLRLPETVDPNAAQATFENGVLRLVFRKSEQAKPKRIAVTAGAQQERVAGVQTGEKAQGTEQPAAGSSRETGRS